MPRQGIRSKRLTVSHAFHSDLMTPMLEEFGRIAATVSLRRPSLALVSNLTGGLVGEEVTDPQYWVRHVREAVRFGEGLRTLHGCGVDTYIELGPRPTLLGLVPGCLPAEAEPRLLASLRPELSDDFAILGALGGCHTQGRSVSWKAVFPDGGRRVELPGYPWQRERYWVDPLPAQAPRGRDTGHPLLGVRIAAAGADAVYETTLSATAPVSWLVEHRFVDRILVPATGIGELVRAAAENYRQDARIEIRGLVLQSPLIIEEDGARRVQVMLTEGGTRGLGAQSACGGGGRCGIDPQRGGGDCRAAPDSRAAIDIGALRSRCVTTMDVAALYEGYTAAGLYYGPTFRGVQTLASGTGEALGEIALPADSDARAYGVHPALLDAALHVVAGVTSADDGAAWVPFEIGQLVVYEAERREALVHVRLAAGGKADAPLVDITVIGMLDRDGDRGRSALRSGAPTALRGRAKRAPRRCTNWNGCRPRLRSGPR